MLGRAKAPTVGRSQSTPYWQYGVLCDRSTPGLWRSPTHQFKLDSVLGPGLLESAYVNCLIYELKFRRLKVEHEKPLPVFYKDVMLDCGYRLDLVVEGQVIIKVKSVKTILPIHEAQLLSYLKLSDCKRGLLLNFNVLMLKDGGIRRMIVR